MPNLSDEEVQSIVDWEFDNAMGKAGDTIANERAQSWNYYLGKALGNEQAGQSQVVTLDVQEVVDGIMPSMLRIFTINDNLLIFEPMGDDDVDAARQETAVVNHTFWKQNEGFSIIWQWVFDALVSKVGIVKAYWSDAKEVSTEEYEGLTAEELSVLLEDDELEPKEQDVRQVEMMVPVMTPIGQISMPQVVELYDVKFRRTKNRGCVKIECVPPEEYRCSADTKWMAGSGRFTGQERDVTRSELVDMGFSKERVWALPSSGRLDDSEEKRARRTRAEEQNIQSNGDESSELVQFREAYIHMDYDMDGYAELRQVLIAGNEVLSNEEIDRCPFHTIASKPLPHKHFGQSVAEIVEEIQKINTTLLRQALDNVYLTNRPGSMVWEQAIGENTIEDLLTTETGRIVRVDRPVGEAHKDMAVPFTAAASFEVMQYFDKLKRDRTGVTQDSELLSPDQLKNIQKGVMSQTLDVARGKIEAIARVFAETGFKSLFLHIHELKLKHQDREEIIKIAGDYVPVDPREWRERTNMTVNVGIGLGSRETNLIHLNAIADRQQQIVQGGGLDMLVTPENLFNTASEIVRNANLKDPERFFQNPAKAEPKPKKPDPKDQVAMQLVQVEQEKVKVQAMKAQVDAQMKLMEAKRKIAELQMQMQTEAQKNAAGMSEAEAKIMIEMEKIANDLTEMELKYGTDVPGAKV